MILIVDDHVETCQVLMAFLRLKGHASQCVHSGADALTYMATQRPGLVVLDLMMPGMNGIEVLEKLKTNPTTADVPVVMLSATPKEPEIDNARKLGAVDFLQKSFTNWEGLVSRLVSYEKTGRA